MNYWVWCLWRSLLCQSSWKLVCRDPNKNAIWLQPGARPESISPIMEKENVWRKRDETNITKSDDVSEKLHGFISPPKNLCPGSSKSGPAPSTQMIHCSLDPDSSMSFSCVEISIWISNQRVIGVGFFGPQRWWLYPGALMFVDTEIQCELHTQRCKSLKTCMFLQIFLQPCHGEQDPIGGNRRWTYSLAVFQQHHSKVEDVRRSTCSLCSLLVATNPVVFEG